MSLRELPVLDTLAEGITLGEYQGIPVVRVQHPSAEAGIALQGGHLLWYRPAGERDLIWLSDQAVFEPGTAIRGGIPVCWPWFGKLGQPSHGFARTSRWLLEDCQITPEGAEVVLSLVATPATLAHWPHRFRNHLVFRIGRALEIGLTCTNTDQTPWTFTGALHSYLKVADVHAVAIEGAGADYLDSVAGSRPRHQPGPVTFDGEVDRVYIRPEAELIIEEQHSIRPIRVGIGGSDAAVIWNPGPQLSAAMADMTDDGYRTMVCVEAAIHQQPITLAPGQSHCLSTRISLNTG